MRWNYHQSWAKRSRGEKEKKKEKKMSTQYKNWSEQPQAGMFVAHLSSQESALSWQYVIILILFVSASYIYITGSINYFLPGAGRTGGVLGRPMIQYKTGALLKNRDINYLLQEPHLPDLIFASSLQALRFGRNTSEYHRHSSSHQHYRTLHSS